MITIDKNRKVENGISGRTGILLIFLACYFRSNERLLNCKNNKNHNHGDFFNVYPVTIGPFIRGKSSRLM